MSENYNVLSGKKWVVCGDSFTNGLDQNAPIPEGPCGPSRIGAAAPRHGKKPHRTGNGLAEKRGDAALRVT